MNNPDIAAALAPVIAALDELGIAYQIGGSVASSACGVPRTTLDVDLVAALLPEQVDALVGRLQPQYYVDANTVREAIDGQSSFNLIHLATMLKVDVFVLKSRRYDQEAFRRRRKERLGEAPEGGEYYFASPEDVILNKLAWYRLGRHVSERQWRDVVGVMKVQGPALDREYLRRWADTLGVADLLERTLEEADHGPSLRSSSPGSMV